MKEVFEVRGKDKENKYTLLDRLNEVFDEMPVEDVDKIVITSKHIKIYY